MQVTFTICCLSNPVTAMTEHLLEKALAVLTKSEHEAAEVRQGKWCFMIHCSNCHMWVYKPAHLNLAPNCVWSSPLEAKPSLLGDKPCWVEPCHHLTEGCCWNERPCCPSCCSQSKTTCTSCFLCTGTAVCLAPQGAGSGSSARKTYAEEPFGLSLLLTWLYQSQLQGKGW